jgi:hypothetical protein
MNQNQTESKPLSVEEPREEGLDETPCSASFAAWLHDYFRAMRFDPSHHLGLGDIRLTIGQQDDLVVAAERAHVGKPNKEITGA